MLPQPSLHKFTHIMRWCIAAEENRAISPLHSHILLKALPRISSKNHVFLSMLLQAGNIQDSLKILEHPNLESSKDSPLDSLIKGYIKCGEFRHALTLYRICERSSFVDPYVLVGLLKACSMLKDAEVGNIICQNVVKTRLLQEDVFIGCALVDMYSKCGLLDQSCELFNILPIRDVVIWTALISGYAQYGYGRQALDSFQHMQIEGINANPTTFVCVLKACGNIRDVNQGRNLHTEFEMNGMLKNNLFVGNALMDMYAKCNDLQEAQDVFEKLPNRDSVSWNTLIGSYVEHDFGDEALKCFARMQLNGISPNYITFSWILSACSSVGVSTNGREIHEEIERKGLLTTNHILGTALVDMYAKCDLLPESLKVFENCLIRDVISWNTLVAGYVEHEKGREALECLVRMRFEGVLPSAITYSCCLKACGSTGSIGEGQEIHAETAREGSLEISSFIGTALIDMYASFGMVEKAHEVSDKLLVHDVSSWNALISGYSKHDCGDKVFGCFEKMQVYGITPNSVTFACLMKASVYIGCIDTGIWIHGEVARMCIYEEDIFLGSMLVDMYAKFGLLKKAQEVFDNLIVKDTVSWTSLIAGYAQQERREEALACFKEMQWESISPDVVTYACILSICGSMRAIMEGRKVHCEIMKKGLLERDLGLSNTLIEMYAKSGSLVEAQEIHDKLRVRDIVSWNVLIGGYVKHENSEEVLFLFKQMQRDEIYPDAVTFAYILKACGDVGACESGTEIHAYIEALGLLATNPIVMTALMDMYAKCGLLAKSKEVFDKLPEVDIVSWNSLITGYAQLGETENVISTFEKIIADGCEPNSVTYVSVLTACSHTGMVDIGHCIFESIIKEFDITHHSPCMIDLFSRVGQLEKAFAIVEHSPSHPNVVMWLILLGACTRWSNSELGGLVFKQVLELHEREAAAYICMGTLCIYEEDI